MSELGVEARCTVVLCNYGSENSVASTVWLVQCYGTVVC